MLGLENVKACRISIRLLDGLALQEVDGSPIRLVNRKAAGLLAYLALSPNSSETRERLAGLLWSDRSEEQARASLRQCLKQLRGLFSQKGTLVFVVDRQKVSLRSDMIEVDLLLTATRLQDRRIDDQLLYGNVLPERILYGLEDLDQAFAAWLHITRRRWHDRFLHDLEAILNDQSFGNVDRKRASEAIIKLDPTHEVANRFLISIHASEGNISAAIRQYSELWELLENEYDMEPSDQTKDLIVSIKNQSTNEHPHYLPSRQDQAALTIIEPPKARYLQTAQAVNRRLLILMESENIEGVASDKHYLVKGFHHDLIASLVKFREWSVLDGGKTAQFPTDPSVDFAKYSLAFSAFGQSNDIKIVITIKETETSRYIWSDQYALSLENWFEAQQIIVRRIAVALNVHLSAERLDRFAAEPDVSLAIYDRWLRGQDYCLRWRAQDNNHAAVIFRSIIDEAPTFGKAYSSLVQVINSRHIAFPGIYRTTDSEREALHIARKGLQIDPMDSRSHLCLAWSLALNRQFEHADTSYRLAYDLNPNDPWTLVSASHGIAFCGYKDEAMKMADEALNLGLSASPVHWSYQAGIRFLCEDYAGCAEAAVYGDDAMYDLPAWRAAGLAHLGRIKEAQDEGHRFKELVRSNWHGETSASDNNITRWILHCFPIRLRRDWERLRDGLASANVPLSNQSSLEP